MLTKYITCITKYVSAISPGNPALEYIDRRLADDNYRGTESSEHNRYDMAEIFTTLEILNKYAPYNSASAEVIDDSLAPSYATHNSVIPSLLRIRDTDLSKRPENTPAEIPYAHFCSEVKKSVGKGTQDSIRKNIFVDLHRMGLIIRYDDSKQPLDPYDSKSVKYVSLSSSGARFIHSDILDRAFIFTKALDRLLGGYIELTLDILKDADYNIKNLTKWEFMFFVSGINVPYSYSISTDECVNLIKEYRTLAPTQKRAVVETLKSKLNPNNFPGDKTAKRDWHNWQNKIDQVFHLFRQTPYFEISGKENEFLSLSTKQLRTKSGELVDIMSRSSSEKQAYFAHHKVGKKSGFELHHVVPLSWAESPEQYKLLDNWLNMVYIDAYSHAQISQNHNLNILMSAAGNDLVLSDYTGHQVYLENNKSLLYSVSIQPQMLDYNNSLRTTI